MRGALFCLVSAAAFGTLGIFGKLASDAGANTATTLLVRFALAGAVFAVVLRVTGRWAALRQQPRRVVLTGLALGAFGYSLQSGLFFAAIERLDVSMVALLLYTYPAFVTVAAIVLGRVAPSLRAGVALTVASAGLVLVLLAGGGGDFEVVGALLALGAALTYTTYILVSDTVIGSIDPLALALLVLTGASASFTVVGVGTGSLELGLSGEAWLWLVLIALVSTVIAVSCFFAGLRRVGPSEAAILSTFEPPVTVMLAFLVLGERLTVTQLAGGALVLAAVVLLQLRGGAGERQLRLGRESGEAGGGGFLDRILPKGRIATPRQDSTPKISHAAGSPASPPSRS
jgi:drug/metabolite transporter (DMT)-like permease